MLRELSEIKEYDEFFEELNNKSSMQKMILYNLALSESERREESENFLKKFSDSNIKNIEIISEDIAIAEYRYKQRISYMAIVNGNIVRETSTYTFDEALLLALLYKYNSSNGFSFLAKSLGMEIGK